MDEQEIVGVFRRRGEQAAGPVLELPGGLRGKTFEIGKITRSCDLCAGCAGQRHGGVF